MFVYKFNNFTQKYYKYDTDDIDLFTDMFDENLHNNDITPMVCNPNQCMYCCTVFSSRNKLFHHLGFMNIDIRRKYEQYGNDYDSNMGDFGLEKKRWRKRRMYKRNRWLKYKLHNNFKKDCKKGLKDLSNLFSNGLTIQ